MEKEHDGKVLQKDSELINAELSEQVLLKEYELQTNVAMSSWSHRYALVGFNLVSIGTLVGLSLNMNQPIMLLIASLISSALGIAWAGENFWIIDKERYKVKLSKKLGLPDRWLGSMPLNNTWDIVKNMFSGKLPGATIGVFLFFAPSLISLIFASVDSYKKGDFLQDYFYVIVLFCIVLISLLFMSGKAWLDEYKKMREEFKS